MSLIPFLFLSPSDASEYVGRWRPQIVAGQILSVSGVNAYTRARIKLRDPECVGMLVNIRNTGYVVHRTGETSYEVASCLWSGDTPSLQEFRDLREWCDCMLSHAHVGAERLDDELERELWELSTLDA